MRYSASLGLAALLAGGATTSAHAQRVAADIRIDSWPVAAAIRIGDSPRPRRVFVDYRRGPAPWSNGRWRRGVRRVVVFYDRGANCYFDHYRRGLEEVRAYQYDGRLYRYDDDRDYNDHDRRYDRDRDYRRDEWSDRGRYDRDDRDYDDDDHGAGRHRH